jgi:hypothetical protein
MSKITFAQKKTWMNYIFISSFHVFIDGKKAEKVTIRKAKSIEVTPGNHNLQIKIGSAHLYQCPVETYSLMPEEEMKISMRWTWFGLIYHLLLTALMVIYLIIIIRDSSPKGFSEALKNSGLIYYAFLAILLTNAFSEMFVKMEQVQ